MSDAISSIPAIPLSAVLATGATTVLLAAALAYVMMNRSNEIPVPMEEEKEEHDDGYSPQKHPGGRITAYYASQTGTAESFAKTLQREGPANGFFVHVVDVEDVQLDDLVKDHDDNPDAPQDQPAKAVFLVATYGEGEPTDNSAEFVTELKDRTGTELLPSAEEEKKDDAAMATASDQSLQKLDYAVFALGNRQYEHFNAMGKFFDAALERCGATRMAATGYGDDDDDIEGDFETWREQVFWAQLKDRYLQNANLPVSTGEESKTEMPTTAFQVNYLEDKNAKPDMNPKHMHNASRPYFTSYDCPVSVNRELRSKDDSGSTVHVEVDISKADGLSYHTADNFAVLPVNEDTIVESVATSLGYDLDAVFSVEAAPGQEWQGAPFPNPCSVRECLTRYCDLTGAPRRSDLKLLAAYATDPLDRRALQRMASKEGKAEYKEKVLEAHYGFADILRMCPSIEAPLEHFLSVCPSLVPRFYTISSSSSVHPQSVHMTVSVTEALRQDGSTFKGVCSNHLALSKPGQTIRVFNRESTFRLPQDTTKPILMVGPGTGVAPMRALLQERQYQRDVQKKKVGKNVLYFGCKKRSLDFLYESEMKAFQRSKILTDLHVAFSREQKEKVYVQHLLAKNGRATWNLMDKEGAHVYVCGGTRMGSDVSEALQAICVQQGGMTADAAKEYLRKLAAEGRYVQELWA